MFTVKFWKATTERMVRGSAIAVSAAYFGGDKVFDSLNVNTWSDAGALAISGALGSLLLSIIGQGVTGNGPSITNSETTKS